jgi:hypothetical protein
VGSARFAAHGPRPAFIAVLGAGGWLPLSVRLRPGCEQASRGPSPPTCGRPGPPPAAELPEVGAELALIGEPCRPGVVVESEPLDDVGHRTSQVPECDHLRGLEADGLDRGRDHSPPQQRAVCREDHVAAPFEHLDLPGHRAWCWPEVWRSDHVEDGLARRSDRDRQRSQRLNPPSETGFHGHLPAHDKAIAGAADDCRSRCQPEPSHVRLCPRPQDRRRTELRRRSRRS